MEHEIEEFDEEAMANLKREHLNTIENNNIELDEKLTTRLDAKVEQSAKETKNTETKLRCIENLHSSLQNAI